MAIRLSGMASGLDTDSIVKELVSAYSTRKDNIVKKQTKLEWTQDAWKEMNTKIYSFYSSKLSNMRFSSSYSKKTSTVSDTSVAKVTASTGAVNGTQKLKVKNLATSGYLTGGEITSASGEKAKTSSKLRDVVGTADGKSLGSVELKVGDSSKTINMSDDMTVQQFVNALKDSGVNASFDEKNQRFFISAKTSGEAGDFSLSASNTEAIDTMKALGIYAVTDAEVKKYTADAAIDIDEAVAKAYEAQKKGYTDATEQKKVLETQEESLVKQQETLASNKEYLEFKKDYLSGLKFDSTEVPVLDENGMQKLDEEGNPVTRTEYSYAADSKSGMQIAEELETEIESLTQQIKTYEDKDELTDDEKAIKATLENRLKAAKEVQSQVGNDTLTAGDFQAVVAANDQKLTETSDKLTETEGKLVSTRDALSSDANLEAYVAERNSEIDEQNAQLKENLTKYYTDLKSTAQKVLDTYKTDATVKAATRIVGEDSEIELNGATFKNNTNTFEINGLTIQATAETGDKEVTITTDTDTDGIYNMIKDFFKDYNELMKSMDTAYYASSAAKYEPLTDEEKEAMTDDQIEKWEKKIKDSLLRRDDTLGTLSSSMKSIMSGAYNIGGQKFSLATFGINTAGYFASETAERGLYHIDGDADDSTSSGNQDKLRAAIASDPDKVVDFFSKLTTDLYAKLTDKMATSSLSSAYTVYNDKQMKTQYSNYTTEISDWEDKIKEYEDRYYKQFSAMETALAKLNSQTSQLSGLFS